MVMMSFWGAGRREAQVLVADRHGLGPRPVDDGLPGVLALTFSFVFPSFSFVFPFFFFCFPLFFLCFFFSFPYRRSSARARPPRTTCPRAPEGSNNVHTGKRLHNGYNRKTVVFNRKTLKICILMSAKETRAIMCRSRFLVMIPRFFVKISRLIVKFCSTFCDFVFEKNSRFLRTCAQFRRNFAKVRRTWSPQEFAAVLAPSAQAGSPPVKAAVIVRPRAASSMPVMLPATARSPP